MRHARVLVTIVCAVVGLASCGKDVTASAGLGGPCSRNADCASPFVCLDARCVAAPVGCDAGTKRCSGSDVEECAADGLTFVTRESCASGCSDGACLPAVCTAGDRRCDGDAIEACVPSGSEWAFVQFCSTTCEAGSCTPPPTVCTAGDARCDGLALERCTPDGTGWAFDHFCALSCTDGACDAPTPVCSAGDTRCDGLALERCTPDGESWAFDHFCETSCTEGACDAPAQLCTAGDTRCDGVAVERCTPDGTAWAFDRFCPYQCADGACAAPACQPFSTRCADAKTLETCAADGSDWVSAACGSDEACEAGVCRPTVCAPATKRCVEKTVQTCNDLGTAWETSADCQVGCVDGACEDEQCTPGEKRCDGTAIEACAPDGSGFVFVDYCATSCADGACTPPTCAPLTKRCNGQDVEVCDGDGGGWTKVDTCPDSCTDGECTAIVTRCEPGALRCNGLDVESCDADGQAFSKVESCLDACSTGACVGAACAAFHLSSTPAALPADGSSTALVTSDLVADAAGVPVPDGTMLTVQVQGGAYASADADPLQAGFQAKTLGGRVKFTVRAPASTGTISVSASLGLSTICTATVTLDATTPAGHRFFAEDFSSTAHRDPVGTSATWDVDREQVRALAYDPTLGVDAGDGHDGDLVVAAGQTFTLDASKRPGLAGPDVAIHQVTYIDTRYGDDFVSVDPPANGVLQPGDEVMLVNLQGSQCGTGNTCDPNIPGWSGYVGVYEFLTVREARADGLVFFTTPVKGRYSDGGNQDLRGQRIFLQRVPNYDHVTIEGTLTTTGWDPDARHTGMIVFRAREGVTVAAGGEIDLDGKGYRGGKAGPIDAFSQGTNDNWTSPEDVQWTGESYIGSLAPASAGATWAGGGAGEYGHCSWKTQLVAGSVVGAGGGFATPGAPMVTDTSASPSGDLGRGGTYGDAALSRLYPGSGAGGNFVDTTIACDQSRSGTFYGGYCSNWRPYDAGGLCGGVDAQCGNEDCSGRNETCTAFGCTLRPSSTVQGGAGGGILAIWTHALNVQGTISVDGVKPQPTMNGGSGGSVLVYADSASLGTNAVHALGAYSSSYAAPADQRPPGDGRIAVNYYDFALTGTTNPPATTNLLGVFRKDLAVSSEVDAVDAPELVTSVKVSPVLATTAGGEVTYSVSADGGRTWTDAAPDADTALDAGARGSDLRWRAIFRPLSTAPLTLDGLVLDYQAP